MKQTTHLRLRVENGLLRRLEKVALKNGRTLTGEIIGRLERSLDKDDQVAIESRVEVLEAYLERYGRQNDQSNS